MINQHQFQQAAKHYRSGRISLSEFQSRVFAGLETNPDPNDNQNSGLTIEHGDTGASLIKALRQLHTAGEAVLVTGVSTVLAQQLSQQFADGQFDSKAQTFACKNKGADNASNGKLAVIAVVDVDANFKTGYLAAIVAADKQQ